MSPCFFISGLQILWVLCCWLCQYCRPISETFQIHTLLLVMPYKARLYLAACGLHPSTLAFIDLECWCGRTERLKAASSMYILQNAAICLSAVAVLLALKITAAWPVPFWFFTSLAIIAGSISSVGCIGSAVSVEREWTKTLSQGDSNVLAHLNSGAFATLLFFRLLHWWAKRLCLPICCTWASYLPS